MQGILRKFLRSLNKDLLLDLPIGGEVEDGKILVIPFTFEGGLFIFCLGPTKLALVDGGTFDILPLDKMADDFAMDVVLVDVDGGAEGCTKSFKLVVEGLAPLFDVGLTNVADAVLLEVGLLLFI